MAAGTALAGLAQFGAAGRAHSASRMDAGAPSETALGAAKLRAAHQILEYPRVLHDPFALPILGPLGESELRAELGQYQLPFPRGLRAAMVLRSRYADDRFHEAARRGVRQYVVLGAGLDTFAYRNSYPEHMLRVLEIDHPATQAWKLARLREMGIRMPESLTFAPVDFERESLAFGLSRAGFRADRTAFFSWLGVSMYLTERAVMETLGYIAALPAGTEVVFDFTVPRSTLGAGQRAVRDAAAAHVARLGEPWITFFDPPELAARLRNTGFSEASVFGPREAQERYFQGRADGFRTTGSHLMAAIV